METYIVDLALYHGGEYSNPKSIVIQTGKVKETEETLKEVEELALDQEYFEEGDDWLQYDLCDHTIEITEVKKATTRIVKIGIETEVKETAKKLLRDIEILMNLDALKAKLDCSYEHKSKFEKLPAQEKELNKKYGGTDSFGEGFWFDSELNENGERIAYLDFVVCLHHYVRIYADSVKFVRNYWHGTYKVDGNDFIPFLEYLTTESIETLQERVKTLQTTGEVDMLYRFELMIPVQ
jgi:hypothetical protein